MLNGTTKGFFQGGRGLRQGDSLSPYLFIILQEVLSRLLKHSVAEKRIGQFSQARGTPLISHLMYADDIVIFLNGSKNSIRELLRVFEKYENWSGHMINKDKTSMFFSRKISLARKRALKRMTGFSEGSFPFKYLGVPIVLGRLKQRHLEEMVNKVWKKISGWKMKILSSGGRLILLRHVLSSMALHLFAVLQVPNSIIKVLNRLMSTFFWGEVNGKGKKKWVAWTNICKPVEEGGLGLRNLDDMQKALHMRFAWNLIQGKSLWARFFKEKYVGSSPWSLLDTKKGTRFWKMIVKSIPNILNNSKWRIRDGNILFWYDKWREDGPLIDDFHIVGNPLLQIKDCKMSNSWDVDLLTNLVGQNNVDNIIEALARCKGGSDVLIWTKHDSGNFNTKSAWDCIRVRGSSMGWHSWVWHKSLPLKISIAMWKAWNMALSVDDRLRRIGIPIVSRCDCCDKGSYEDQNHVLFEGVFATKIWHYCGTIFGLPIGRSWMETVTAWFRRASSSSQVGRLVGFLPSIITWQLWQRRCTARMEGRFEPFNSVWHAIKSWMTSVCQDMNKVNTCSRYDLDILQALQIPALAPVRPHFQLVS